MKKLNSFRNREFGRKLELRKKIKTLIISVKEYNRLKKSKAGKFIKSALVIGSLVLVTLSFTGIEKMSEDNSYIVPAIMYMMEYDAKDVMPAIGLPEIFKEKNMNTVQAAEFTLGIENPTEAAEFK